MSPHPQRAPRAVRGDRTVHARYPGIEIVRYDRAGKWYREATAGYVDSELGLTRRQIGVGTAAKEAAWGVEHANGTVYFGRLGGSQFDRKVDVALEAAARRAGLS